VTVQHGNLFAAAYSRIKAENGHCKVGIRGEGISGRPDVNKPWDVQGI
jgi:hypothetical protein